MGGHWAGGFHHLALWWGGEAGGWIGWFGVGRGVWKGGLERVLGAVGTGVVIRAGQEARPTKVGVAGCRGWGTVGKQVGGWRGYGWRSLTLASWWGWRICRGCARMGVTGY